MLLMEAQKLEKRTAWQRRWHRSKRNSLLREQSRLNEVDDRMAKKVWFETGFLKRPKRCTACGGLRLSLPVGREDAGGLEDVKVGVVDGMM